MIFLLEKECEKSDASPSLLISLAETYSREKDKEEKAIELYRRALAWIMESDQMEAESRKTALAQSGKSDDAMHEANICLKIQPQLKEAEDLIGELSVRQGKSVKEAEKP